MFRADDGRTNGNFSADRPAGRKFFRNLLRAGQTKTGCRPDSRTPGRPDIRTAERTDRRKNKTKKSKCVSNDRSHHDDQNEYRIIKIGAILKG